MSQASDRVSRLCSNRVRGKGWRYTLSLAAVTLLVMSCADNQKKSPVAPGPLPDEGPAFGAVTSSNGVGACLLDDVIGAAYVNSGDVQCTSKDIDIAIAKVSEYSFTSVAGPFTTLHPDSSIACTPNQTIYVRTSAVLLNNAQERYDVGLWINPVAGGSALTGTNCTHFNLLTGDDSLGVSNLDGDQCGDVDQDSDTVTVPLDVLTLTCADPDNNGFVEVGACAAWQNSIGEDDPTDPDSRVCPVTTPPRTGPTTTANGFRWGTTPETPAKCKCEPLSLPIEIKSILRIAKVTVPAGNSTPFTFTPTGWNGGSTFTRAGNQGSFASAPLDSGAYSVSETVLAGWELTGRTCVNTSDQTPYAFTTPTSTSIAVVLDNGADVTCTFTNTRQPTLQVFKACVPTSDNGLFNLRIDGATAAGGANEACGGSTDVIVTTAGTHTVSETAGTGTSLANYSSAITGDCAANGTVTLAAGDVKTCTITNTRLPRLTVTKICVPTNDPGLFNLRIDGATAAGGANEACGGSTDVIVTTIGTHTVSETAGTGTNLADYASVIGQDCAANGTVTLAAGDNKTCTITNTKKATLTVVKACLPTNDTGLFNLQIDGVTAAGGANEACGGSTEAVTVTVGTHTVGETAGTGTNLANYSSAITGDCAANGTVTLAAGDNKTCTITNTRLPRLTVTKICAPTNDAGRFNLRIDGATAAGGADEVCGGSTDVITTTIGTHTVSETAGTGTNLANYSTVIGQDCAANGTVTLAAGDNKTCTITNTRLPRLTVQKVCVPTSDTGLFNLRIDGATAAGGADEACGGSTDVITTTIGTHTVSETAGTGTNLANYASSIGGQCASDGTVTLAAGDNKTCTITNSRLPNLKVVKTLGGASATFQFTGTGTGVSANFSLTPPTDDADSVTFSNIPIGTKTITETLLSGYLLTDLSCDKGGVIYDPTVTQTVSVTLAYGDNVRCVFVNNQQTSDVTRTQGFWSTHRSLASAVWFGTIWNGIDYAGVADRNLCGKEIDSIEKLMGGFWAGISQTSTKTKRSELDQARMRLLQQLLAAMLNQAAFGSFPDGTGDDYSIAEAELALCDDDISAINDAHADMAAFNEGGDSGDFTPGGSANAKLAKSTANIAFWDTWPLVWP